MNSALSESLEICKSIYINCVVRAGEPESNSATMTT